MRWEYTSNQKAEQGFSAVDPGWALGAWAPLVSKISSKSCSFQGISRGKAPTLSKFWVQAPPLGSKLRGGPLTKILDPRLILSLKTGNPVLCLWSCSQDRKSVSSSKGCCPQGFSLLRAASCKKILLWLGKFQKFLAIIVQCSLVVFTKRKSVSSSDGYLPASICDRVGGCCRRVWEVVWLWRTLRVPSPVDIHTLVWLLVPPGKPLQACGFFRWTSQVLSAHRSCAIRWGTIWGQIGTMEFYHRDVTVSIYLCLIRASVVWIQVPPVQSEKVHKWTSYNESVRGCVDKDSTENHADILTQDSCLWSQVEGTLSLNG